MKKYPVDVVGMGICRADLCTSHLEAVRKADFLAGSKRHLKWFEDHPGRKRKIEPPLSALIEEIEDFRRTGRVAVLASGDPLFFGIGNTLIRHFGTDAVRIYPNVSSMAAAFSRINRSWQNASAVSLHARNAISELRRALCAGGPVFVLTDPQNGPAAVAQIVMQCVPGKADFWVAERLGMEDERITKIAPEQAAGKTWLEPSSVIIEPEKKQEISPGLFPGAPEDSYAHTGGMITKSEVRAVILSKLCLEPHHVFWDLGAASGSVAIEAALFVKSGRIIAVEKDPDRAAHIRENAEKYAPGRIEVTEGVLPGAMEDLPDPDRVFVGGGGKDLFEITGMAARRLAPGGIIAVSAVVLENLGKCLAAMKQAGLSPDAVQLQVSRSSPMEAGMRMQALNPVFIITGEKGIKNE
ncbi:MAG: precorrin-6y C5,15-methyltransferase (decarboxylating) subunit CbiE [Desulfosalsimonas sp.]